MLGIPFLCIVLAHLTGSLVLTFKAVRWSPVHPAPTAGADEDDRLLNAVLFASFSGAFLALPALLFTVVSLPEILSRRPDTDMLVGLGTLAMAVIAWAPVAGLNPRVRSRAKPIALLGGIAAFATVAVFFGIAYTVARTAIF